jgi:hypothetical protein
MPPSSQHPEDGDSILTCIFETVLGIIFFVSDVTVHAIILERLDFMYNVETQLAIMSLKYVKIHKCIWEPTQSDGVNY